MTDGLNFSIVLKEEPVTLEGKDGMKKYTLRELTSVQRKSHTDFNKIEMEMVDGKAKLATSGGFKVMSAHQFLALCLYDDKGVIVSEKTISVWPGRVTSALHAAGLKLSGMDQEAEDDSKNESRESDTNGTE